MSRFVPKLAMLSVLAFAGMMSGDVGPRFVRTPHVVVWYDRGITTEQAQAFLSFFANDVEREGGNPHDATFTFRLTREPDAVRVCFDNMKLAALTPELLQVFYNCGTQAGALALPGERLVIEAADGAGQVLPIEAPSVEPPRADEESLTTNG